MGTIGNENLLRNVLVRSAVKNGGACTSRNWKEQSVTSDHFAGVTETTQDKYICSILNMWCGEKRDPEELFNKGNWKQWIRKESERRDDQQRFINPAFLNSYASTLMAMFCDVGHPYFHRILSDNPEKETQLLNLKRMFDERELNGLLKQANGKWDDDDSDNESDLNSCFIAEPSHHDTMPLKLSNVRSLSPQCSMEDRRSSSPELQLFKDLPQTKGRQSTQADSPRRNKRSISGNSVNTWMPVGDSTKKRHRSDNSRPVKPLNIKTIPRILKQSSGCSSKLPSDPVERKVHREVNENRFEPICSEEDANRTCELFENSDYLNDDVIIENPTPPCSPAVSFSTHEKDVTGRSSLSDSFNATIVSTNNACSTSSSAQRKVYSKLSGSESKTNEQGRIKGIRSSSKEPLTTQTQSDDNKVFEFEDAHDELPDIDPIVDQDKENYPVSVDEIAIKFPKPSTAPALTLEMFEVFKKALEKPAKEKIVTGFSLYILQEDLAVYDKETEWLNDRNIDFYLELIRERSTQSGYPRVYIFHSFFYTLLTDKDGGYEVVQETTGEDDLFQYDIVFFPVNLNQHWRLVVVKFQEKSLQCYDSMRHENDDVLKNIGRYLRKEYHRKHRKDADNKGGYCTSASEVSEDERSSPVPFCSAPGQPLRTRKFFDWNAWNVENVSSETIPQQKNAIDCGIFLLQYAEYLSRGVEFDFDQSHISYFRKRMMYETLTKQLLTSSGNENIGIP